MKQREALEILKTGENIFLTGSAGSGKTFLLNQYIEYLKENKINISITASTGIAATHLNGRTIHSWSGIGINEELTKAQMKALKDRDYFISRILSSKVLIIDEISMLNAKRLDLVDNICKVFRQDLRPFGGMQVVFCGDFFQLPPVAKDKEDNRFVTESEIWNDMNMKICYLDEQHRQEDKRFLRVLNDIRKDSTNEETIGILKERHNKSVKSNIKPTKLYTHNIDVDAINEAELAKLEGDELVYDMYSEGTPYLIKNLKGNYCLVPEKLRLKIDAIVMFLKNNFSEGYVNGTLGKVIGFDENSNYPIVETFSGKQIIAEREKWIMEDGNKVVASINQVPLRLAWAITVHKSQGMSLDCAEIDLSKTFEYGMGYVALSRVRSLAGIKLLGINDLSLKVNKEAGALDKHFISKSKEDLNEYKKIGKKEINKKQNRFLEENKDNDVDYDNILGLPF